MNIRNYKEEEEQGWLRCRVLAFLHTAYSDNVLNIKEIYEHLYKRGGIDLKKIIWILSLLLLVACSDDEDKYDGAPLKIAVVGDIPELNNEKIHFESISLDEFSEDPLHISANFDAVMITPAIFEAASDDKFVEVYKNSTLPIIFFDSSKRHYPFTRGGATYETAHWDSLNNGSHTTIYLSDIDTNSEDAWYFYLKDEKELDILYKEIFQKVETL